MSCCYDYDWRGDLLALGARARRSGWSAIRPRELALVGHSMGGLLARAALAQLARRRRRAHHAA